MAIESGEPIQFPRIVVFNKNYEEPVIGMNKIPELIDSSDDDYSIDKSVSKSSSKKSSSRKSHKKTPVQSPAKAQAQTPAIPQNYQMQMQTPASGPPPVQLPGIHQRMPSSNIQSSHNAHKRQKVTEIDPAPPNPPNIEIPKSFERLGYSFGKVDKNKDFTKLVEEVHVPISKLQSLVKSHSGLKSYSEKISGNFAHISQEKVEKIKQLEVQEESKIFDPFEDKGSLAVQRSVHKSHKAIYQKDFKTNKVN